MTHSVTASNDASSLSSSYNYKSNLLTDKIVLPDADNEKKKKKKSNIIIVIQAAPEPLTSQTLQKQSKHQ